MITIIITTIQKKFQHKERAKFQVVAMNQKKLKKKCYMN